MRTLGLIAVTIGIWAGGLPAAKILNEDMVLTVDYATGAATLKNVGTVAHHVEIYQIKSVGPNPLDSAVAAYLNPGARATTDPISGEIIPSSPGTWKGICDACVTDIVGTMTTFGASVASFSPIMSSDPVIQTRSISEGTLTTGAYANFKTTALPYSIGNPVLPGMASLSDLSFYWRESGQSAADTYIGKIIINTPAGPTISVGPGTVTLPSIIVGGTSPSSIIAVTETGGFSGAYSVGSVSAGNYHVVGAAMEGNAIAPYGAAAHAVTYADVNAVGSVSGSITIAGDTPTTGGTTVTLEGHIYDHASGSAASTFISLPTAIVGYSTLTGSTSMSNASGDRVDLKTTGATGSNGVSLTNVRAVAAGTSKAITATLDPGRGVGPVCETFTRTYADDSSLSGASNSLRTETVVVTGHIYDHADASAIGTTIAFPTAIVGYSSPVSGTTTTGVSNAAGDRVNLKTTGATDSNGVFLTNATGVTQGTSKTISATLNTGRGVGAISEAFTRTYADDSPLSGAADNLGGTTVTVTGSILDHSSASFQNLTGAGTPTLGAKTLTLNFGSVYVDAGGGYLDSLFDVFANVTTPGATAGLDLDLIDAGTGDVGRLYRQAGLTDFTNLPAGTGTPYAFRFDTSTVGTYSATYHFKLSDQDLPGATIAGSDVLTLTLTGRVTRVRLAQIPWDGSTNDWPTVHWLVDGLTLENPPEGENMIVNAGICRVNDDFTVTTTPKALTIGGTGRVEVGAVGSLKVAQEVTVQAGGTLQVNGGALSAGAVSVGGTLRGSGIVTAPVTGLAGSLIEATGALALGDTTAGNGFATDGELHTAANLVTLRSAGTVTLGSTTTLGSGGTPGTLKADSGLVIGVGRTVSGEGTIDTPNDATKALTNNGLITSATTITLKGYVKGTGQFQNVVFSGTFSPGDGPAGVSLGNAWFTSGSVLEMEIGGADPGTQSDNLVYDGAATLSGTLNLSLINGFVPAYGQTFDIIDCGLRLGLFDAVAGPVFNGHATLNALYSDTGVSLLAAIPGDANLDGEVGPEDFAAFKDNFGQSGPGIGWSQGDCYNDGEVGLEDFALLKDYFGQAADVPLTTVPEPATLALLGVGGVLAMRKRRK
ncbi:MAG: PEP-CTERM sorting domain-containing protein [Planctomycetota bacterium]|nr:PEP-CTERM sorting domain-containing protein [Planctomycetota bacterium]